MASVGKSPTLKSKSETLKGNEKNEKNETGKMGTQNSPQIRL
jgi:hypothetical protein